MHRIFLIIVCCFCLQSVYAQSESDELESALQYCSNLKRIPKDSLEKYARKAVRLASDRHDRPRQARAYAYMARFYLNSSLKDSALYALGQVDRYFGSDRPSMLAKNNADMMRGSLLVKSNRHKEAIEWYFQIMDRVKSNDTFNYLGILHGIGWANMELGRFEEAKRWFLKVVYFPDTVYEASRVITLCNLSATYAALHQLDSAEYFVRKTISLSRKHHSLIAEANALNIYGDLLIEQQHFAEAEDKIQQAIELRKQIGDPFYIISDMAQLSTLYGQWGHHDKGIAFGMAAKRIADSLQIDAKMPMIYEALRRNYLGIGDYKKSAEIAGVLLALKDSLNNKASAESLAEMEVRYESAKKEHQIQLQTYELSRKNILVYGSAAFSALLCLLFFVLWRLNRQRQEHRLQSIRLQEQELAAKAVLAAEEHERQRLSELLHDGVGQQLSALKMNLQVLEPGSPGLSSVYDNVLALTHTSIEQVRNISHGLSPRNVLRQGLAASLERLRDQLPGQSLNLELDLQADLSQLSPEAQLSIFRIVQEALNNVLKHARASYLRVQVKQSEHSWQWVLQDDGVGFDRLSVVEGIGLAHISARARFLNGVFRLETEPGKGTALHLVFPI